MQPSGATGVKPPSRIEMSEPSRLVFWARQAFLSRVGAGAGPDQALEEVKGVFASLKVPERLILRCRVQVDQVEDVVLDWTKFEARLDESQGVWYLHMPGTLLNTTTKKKE